MNPVTSYVNEISSMYGSGQATEHSYRSTLEGLFKAFDESVQVINEPRHLDFGAPDMVLQLAGQPVGYVECKDLHIALNEVENNEQLTRYRKAVTTSSSPTTASSAGIAEVNLSGNR